VSIASFFFIAVVVVVVIVVVVVAYTHRYMYAAARTAEQPQRRIRPRIASDSGSSNLELAIAATEPMHKRSDFGPHPPRAAQFKSESSELGEGRSTRPSSSATRAPAHTVAARPRIRGGREEGKQGGCQAATKRKQGLERNLHVRRIVVERAGSGYTAVLIGSRGRRSIWLMPRAMLHWHLCPPKITMTGDYAAVSFLPSLLSSVHKVIGRLSVAGVRAERFQVSHPPLCSLKLPRSARG